MRSPAALLVLVASLSGSLARADEPAPAPAVTPLPVPPIVAAPLLVPPVVAAPPPYARPYYLPPPWWALPVPMKERHSKGMMITGIVFFGAGAVVTTAGLALLGIAESGPCDEPDRALTGPPPPVGGGGPARHPPPSRPTGEALGTARQADSFCGNPSSVNVALGVLAAGVLGSGVGIPLFLVGNKKERARPHYDDAAAPALPALRVGAGSASLRWSF